MSARAMHLSRSCTLFSYGLLMEALSRRRDGYIRRARLCARTVCGAGKGRKAARTPIKQIQREEEKAETENENTAPSLLLAFCSPRDDRRREKKNKKNKKTFRGPLWYHFPERVRSLDELNEQRHDPSRPTGHLRVRVLYWF